MKYLIAVDSDGTLRHTDGTISPYTKDVISKLINKGHYVIICTARPRYHTIKIAEESGASPYIISSNGAEVYDYINETVISASFVSISHCEILYNYAKEYDLRIVFVTENKEYVTKFIRNKNQILLTDNNIKNLLSHNIKQIMVIGPEKKKILNLKNAIINKFNIINSSSDLTKEEIWFSVGGDNASKGNAVITLANHLSISLDNTIALGNDYNDLSMFLSCKISVAVQNSSDEIKANATIITESNDDDGVAKYLETII